MILLVAAILLYALGSWVAAAGDERDEAFNEAQERRDEIIVSRFEKIIEDLKSESELFSWEEGDSDALYDSLDEAMFLDDSESNELVKEAQKIIDQEQ